MGTQREARGTRKYLASNTTLGGGWPIFGAVPTERPSFPTIQHADENENIVCPPLLPEVFVLAQTSSSPVRIFNKFRASWFMDQRFWSTKNRTLRLRSCGISGQARQTHLLLPMLSSSSLSSVRHDGLCQPTKAWRARWAYNDDAKNGRPRGCQKLSPSLSLSRSLLPQSAFTGTPIQSLSMQSVQDFILPADAAGR